MPSREGAGRQGAAPGGRGVAFLRREPPLRVQREGVADAFEQELIGDRFLQEVHGAIPDGADRHRDVPVAGNDDHGQRKAVGREPALQLDPAHPAHAHVEHQAPRPRGATGGQEGLRRVVGLHRETLSLEKLPERIAQSVVVIDHEDFGLSVRHRPHPRPRAVRN